MGLAEKIWFDGKLVDWDDAKIHVHTHALHYGLGFFEGVRSYETVDGGAAVFRLKDHTKRLFESGHIAQMEIPFSEEEINDAIKETIKANGLKSAYIRPLVFLGEGSMGLYPKDNPVQVSISAWEFGAYLGEDGLKNGIKVKVSSFNRHHVNAAMTKAKISGYYVNSIFAKREAITQGFDEAVMLDTDGYVSEGSGENIFIVKDGIVKTTPIGTVLRGITRNSVIKMLKDEGYEVIEEKFTRDELYIADEAFFTGTAAEVTPIREVDGRQIGAGKPGPATKKVQDIFFDTVKGKVDKYKDWLDYV